MKRLRSGDVLSEIGPPLARVAAVTAVVLAAIAVAIVATRPHGTYEVNAIFDDSRGLIEGGNVTAGFQKVGTVKKIVLAGDGLPHVTMSIDGDFVLHQGATANIRLASNVGAINRVVDLTTGNPSLPRLGDGDTLGPSSTDQPVNLDQAFSALDPKTRADAARLLAGLDAATRGRGADINHLLRHSSEALNQTANVLGEVAADGLALRSLVANTATVTGALAGDTTDLAGTADRTAQLLRVAGARQADLRRAVGAIGPAFSSGRLTLENVTAATPDLRGLVREARPLVEQLGPLARRLPPAIRQLRPTLSQAHALVRAFPPQARRLQPLVEAAIPLIRELRPTLALLNPILDHLRVRAPELVGFFQLGADAISNYDVNGHAIRFIPQLIQLPLHPNLIGPSDPGPGSLIRPFDRTPGSLNGDPWNDYASSFIGGGQNVANYKSGGGRRP